MSRTNKRNRRLKVVGVQRKEPDVRRLAKVIIRLSMGDPEVAGDQLRDLVHQEREQSRRRKGQADEPTDKAAS